MKKTLQNILVTRTGAGLVQPGWAWDRLRGLQDDRSRGLNRDHLEKGLGVMMTVDRTGNRDGESVEGDDRMKYSISGWFE